MKRLRRGMGGRGLGGPFAANGFVQAAFLIGFAMRKALSVCTKCLSSRGIRAGKIVSIKVSIKN
jgi:hypothetical protein